MTASILHQDYLAASGPLGSTPALHPVSWSPPPVGTVTLNVDGSFHCAGGAGIGAVARDSSGQVLFGLARHIDDLSEPEFAEHASLLAGLHLALDRGWTSVQIEMDSAQTRCALIGAAVTAVICVRLTWFLSVAAAVFWAIVAAVYFGNSPLLWLSFWFNLSGCHSLTVQGPGYYLLRIPRLWNPRLPPSRILWLRRWRFHLADYNFLWCPLVLSPLAAVFTFAGTSSALHMGGAWPSQYVSAVCSFPWILRTDFRVDPKPWGPAEDRTVPPARLVVPFERSGPHPDLLGSLGPLESHIAMGYHLCLRWTYLMLHNFKAPGAFSTLLNRATYMFPAGLLTGYYYNPAIIIFGFLALGGPVHVWIRLQSGHNYSWTIFGRPVSWHDPRIDVGHFLSSVGRPTRDVYMGPCILSQWTSAVATSEQPNADVVLSITLQRAAPVCIRPPWATILSLWTQSFLQPGWHIELWHAAWPLLQVTYLPLPLSCPLVSHVPRFSSSSPGYLKNSAPALTLTTNSHLHSLIRYLNLLLISLYTMDSEILSAIGNLTFTVEETGEIMIETQQPRPGPRKRSGIEYFTEQIPVQSESTHEASSPSFSNEGAATGTAAGRTDSSTAGGMASSDAGHANSNPSQGLRGAGTETNATNLSAPVDATAKGDPLPAVVTAAPSEIEPHVVVVPEAIANSFEDSRTAAKGSLSAAPSESDLPAHGTALLQVECTISKDLLAQCINSESRENMVEPDNILTHAALDSLKSAIAPPLPRASKHSLQGKYEDYLAASGPLGSTPALHPVSWSPPPVGTVTLNVDGSFHCAGGAGIGVVARDSSGQVLCGLAQHIDDFS
ncbi:hypothetical protein V6N11_035763 [Hibiscus sabdariffa]|uniref:RNase H type-1 domain-containing protein n=1 Tax=Hibiscus sabdariffa TaxID=183260 RepID=A0ABR2R8Y5_9ROSI